MRSHRFAVFFALFGGLLSAEARADAPAAALARLLHSPRRAHPLADGSGRIPVVVPLPDGADARALGLLPVAPGVGSIRLAPENVGAFADVYPELTLLAGPPRRPLLDKSTFWTHAGAYRESTGQAGEGVIVGVVDTGLDVTHPDFRTADGKTRILWMLQAGPPAGLHPDLEEEYGCTDPEQTACAIFCKDDIDAMLASGDPGILRDPNGHGTHVASIAAGNGGPMVTGDPRYIGVAPAANLIVAAPSPPGEGFQDPDILNSVRFIFDRAADPVGCADPHEKVPMPAVVNLSLGGDFGPHDGTSPLEKGLAAMVGDDKPGRAIVVAAGNSGTLYTVGGDGPMGIHTEAHVSAYAVTRVPIRTPKSKSGQGYVWITFQPGDEVSVGLEGPGGETWIGLTDPGEESGYEDKDTDTTGAVINRLANGKSPITTDTNSAVVAWDGAWDAGEFAVLLEGKGDAQLWLVGMGDVSTSKDIGLQFVRGVKQGTINVPASHPGLLAVGCTVNRTSWTPLDSTDSLQLTELGGQEPEEDSMCYFSSAGPTPAGSPKPEISAPGAFVAAAMARDADPRTSSGGLFDVPGCPDASPSCYVVDDYHAIAAGTSMSAPHVAGAVALLFQSDPNLTQARVTEIIQAGARYPKGSVPHPTQLGPGELDMEGASSALAVEMAEDQPIEPSIEKSWYVLSSVYARPDPTWPVWGTIELRRDDGSIASGLDGTKLNVSVTGGSLVKPLTKVRHGLWRFAAAAPEGAGGTTMTIDVLYDGISLGARELPVGVDVWVATGEINATSAACASAAAGVQGGGAWALTGLAAAALARRRRSRCTAVA